MMTRYSKDTKKKSSSEDEGSLLLPDVKDTTRSKNNNHGSLLPTDQQPATTMISLFSFSLVICILISLVSGTIYGFGRYSRDLKNTLRLTQIEMELLGVLLDTGNYVGHPVAGYIYDKFSTKISCIIAAILVFVSYTMMHILLAFHNNSSATGSMYEYDYEYEYERDDDDSSGGNDVTTERFYELSSQSTTNMSILGTCFFMVGMGSGLGYIAALGSTTKMFTTTSSGTVSNNHTLANQQSKKRRRSIAIGIVAAAYGLSSTLVGISYSIVGGMNHFFLLWAILVAMANLLGAVVLPTSSSSYPSPSAATRDDIIKEEKGNCDKEEEEHLALFARSPGGDENGDDDEHDLYDVDNDDDEQADSYRSSYQTTTITSPAKLSKSSTLDELTSTGKQQSLQEWTSWKTCDFWLLFVAFCGCTGCGLFLINNVSTIVESVGGTDLLAERLVVLLSLCNCFGRIGMGFLAGGGSGGKDGERGGTSTTATKIAAGGDDNKLTLFVMASAVMAIGMLISGLATEQSATTCLIVTVPLVAMTYGGSWVLIVGLLADWFGQVNFGKNYGLTAMGPALSGMALNAISAWTYQRNIGVEEVVPPTTTTSSTTPSSSSEICLGTECYHSTFLLCACAATICMVAFPMLRWKRRNNI